MTREEAKQVFLSRGYVEVEGGTIYDADKWRESCRVISEWLEQEPCEDAISRQAVLDATVKRNSIWNGITNSKGENFEEIILQLSPVTPQPKTNQEYIATLSPVEFWKKIQWLQKEYGKRYTDSYQAIIEWLSAKRSDKE